MEENKPNGFKKFMILDKNDNISHSKLWSNLGYASLIGVFIYAGVFGVAVDPTLLLVFGGVVIGNRTLKVALKDLKPKG